MALWSQSRDWSAFWVIGRKTLLFFTVRRNPIAALGDPPAPPNYSIALFYCDGALRRKITAAAP